MVKLVLFVCQATLCRTIECWVCSSWSIKGIYFVSWMLVISNIIHVILTYFYSFWYILDKVMQFPSGYCVRYLMVLGSILSRALPYFTVLVNTIALARRRKKTKKSLKTVIFKSQKSHQDRSQGLKKTKYWTFKNLDLVAAQCNTALWPALILYKNILTVQFKTSFYLSV